MATVSNVRVQWLGDQQPRGSILLDELPFAAALVDGEGTIMAANQQWLAQGPAANVSSPITTWSSEVYPFSPERRTSLAAGVRSILAGKIPRFAQHHVTVTPASSGALVVWNRPGPEETGDPQQSQSQKMEIVGRLVGGVAHDFANLLTMVSGYSEIVLNRLGERDPLRLELEEIRQAANHGSRLTGQLLGFVRGQGNNPAALDLNTLVNDLQRMLRPIIGEYIDLQTDLKPDLGKVMADRGQMEQVIINLVLNARDAMPSGGRVLIETCNGELSEATAQAHGMKIGRCVMLSVSDNGPGIQPEALERVFQPFYTTKESGKGTGLGLDTVRKVIRQSGGDVWVRSAPGAGASFTICLPLVEDRCDAQESAPSHHRPEVAGSETVLLVEDEDGVRKLLSYVLNKRGYHVLEAHDGLEALSLFQEHSDEIQLVLTDMVMPRMTGRELGERLRDMRPDLKIIYMSGYTNDVLLRTGALDNGMSFLQKPLKPEVIAAKVREALDSPSRPLNPS